MKYPKEVFKRLAEELKGMAVPPEIELLICFPGIEEEDCEEETLYPTVIVRYLGGFDEEGPEKKLVFNEAYWNSSVEQLKGAVMHQIKSLMEELQSFEGE
jgi:hypothetical protein